jgi:predicted TIM-barrel fold metal-dependent hydrolase
MMHIPGLKFSTAHCGWPWVDECIALYGKLQFLHDKQPGLCEMFLDLTPGTPVIYRRELITKLITVGYDVKHNILFGTDCFAENYNAAWARKWMDIDNGLYAELNVDDETRRGIYGDNFLRFIGAADVKVTKEVLSIDGRGS